MKEKLWFLITDSILESYAGTDRIMKNTIDISLDILSELENLDKELLRNELYQNIEEVMKYFNYNKNNWDLIIEVLEKRFEKIKKRIDDGEFTKQKEKRK